MNQGVPRETAELLWQVAESGDPQAIAAFRERYPQYASNLDGAVRAANALRSCKPPVQDMRFVPQTHRTSNATKRRALAIGSLVAGGLAFAAVWPAINRPVRQPAVQPVESQPAVAEDPVKGKDELNVPKPDAPATTGTQPVETPTEPPSPFEKTVTIDVSSGSLLSVLEQVAHLSGVKLEVAPGFEDLTVSARYINVSARDVFTDLGQSYGFTVLEQGEKEALVIPALDPERGPIEVPPGSGTEPAVSDRMLQSPEGPGN